MGGFLKHVTATFFKGLFTLLPLLLSIYVLLWFIGWVESFASSALIHVLPFYVPGMGILVTFGIIYAFGVVVDRPLAMWIFKFLENLFREIPIMKTVYLAIKDFTEFLKPGKPNRPNQVVLVRFPGSPVEMVGLMTRESLVGMPEAVTKDGKVAVYFPMSYQIGGCTVFIPKAWVHPTEMSVETAMRSIITAWLPGAEKKVES